MGPSGFGGGDFGVWFLAGALCFLGAGVLFRRAARPAPGTGAAGGSGGEDGSADTPPEPEWTPADKIAWQRVEGFARRASGAMLMDQHALIATASAVAEDVARHYWPDRSEPLWHFTLPEALLLAERVSRRTRTLTIEAVPGSRSIGSATSEILSGQGNRVGGGGRLRSALARRADGREPDAGAGGGTEPPGAGLRHRRGCRA